MATSVKFNGVELTTKYLVVNVTRPYPSLTLDTRTVPGRDGSILLGAQYAPLEINMELVARGGTHASRRAALRTLMSTLNVTEPKRLEFGDDGGKYYLAIPANNGKPENWINADAMQLTFYAADPVMYSGDSRATATYASSKYTVTGTYKTGLYITVAGAQPGTSGYFGLRLNDVDIIKIPLLSGSHAVVVDCDTRTITVDNVATLPTIDSDWFVVDPGKHKVVSYIGSKSSMTVQYWPRWL